jgi:hypothetical protein
MMATTTVWTGKPNAVKDACESEQNPRNDEAKRLRMALRDLIWRVDHLRKLVETTGDALTLEQAVDLLDTSDSRAVLGIK